MNMLTVQDTHSGAPGGATQADAVGVEARRCFGDGSIVDKALARFAVVADGLEATEQRGDGTKDGAGEPATNLATDSSIWREMLQMASVIPAMPVGQDSGLRGVGRGVAGCNMGVLRKSLANVKLDRLVASAGGVFVGIPKEWKVMPCSSLAIGLSVSSEEPDGSAWL